jgi:hypothetical protein
MRLTLGADLAGMPHSASRARTFHILTKQPHCSPRDRDRGREGRVTPLRYLLLFEASVLVVSAALAFHFLFVLAFLPFPLNLTTIGGAELELAILISMSVIPAPAALAALILPRISHGYARR